MPKRLTKTESDMYLTFRETFPFCWACRVEHLPNVYYHGSWRHLTQELDAAHIVGGSGRTADRRNITRLCRIHHGAQHGTLFRATRSTPLPRVLTLGNMCWLKQRFDTEFFDLEYIQSLRIKHAEVIELEPFG